MYTISEQDIIKAAESVAWMETIVANGITYQTFYERECKRNEKGELYAIDKMYIPIGHPSRPKR